MLLPPGFPGLSAFFDQLVKLTTDTKAANTRLNNFLFMIHRKAAITAAIKNVTLNDFVKTAIDALG